MRAEAERLVCEAVRRTLWSIQGQQVTPEGTGSPEGLGDPRQWANSLAITAAWL